MFITCLLAIALSGSLWTAFRANDSAYAAIDAPRQMQIAMELIGRDLQAALPESQTNSADPTTALIGPFEGEAQGTNSQLSPTIEFYAILSGVDSNDPTKADGMKRIDLELTSLDDGTQALVENINPALPGDQQLITSGQSSLAPPVAKVLCRNVASFTAQYSDGQNWYDTWDATAYTPTFNLPMAVQITVQLKPTPLEAAKGREGMSMTKTFAIPTGVLINTTTGGTS
jgi:hypothetical protein